VFPVAEVPEMPRGKGNKLFNIPAALAKERAEVVSGIAVVPPGGKLLVWSGERSREYSAAEIKEFSGARAQRGAVLTRGWRAVTRLEVS
jgi:topoisomerase-4 subunit A